MQAVPPQFKALVWLQLPRVIYTKPQTMSREDEVVEYAVEVEDD